MLTLRFAGLASLLGFLGLFSCVSDDTQNTSSSGRSSSSSGSNGGSSSGTSSGDASSSGGAPWDGTCDPTKPFGVPAEVTEINTPKNETRARISPDGLALYFSRYATGTESWNLVVYSRKDELSKWTAAESPAVFNPYEGPPGPSQAARTSSLAFLGPNGGAFVSMLDVAQPTSIGFAKQRSLAPAIAWGEPVLVADLKAGADSPWFAPDVAVAGNGRLYFSMPVETDGGQPASGLYYATRTSGAFGPSASVALGMPSQSLYAPVLSKDESLLYFAAGQSERRKIYVASRMAGTFKDPVELKALNLGTFNEPSWISSNGCEIYFTSNPNMDSNGVPHLDVFYARRPK